MNPEIAVAVIDSLIQATSLEINSLKSGITGDIVLQVAMYSHDHIVADRLAFGVLSSSPSLADEDLQELEKMKAVLLDREQRRNALKHLKHLLQNGNLDALGLLQKEVERFFSTDETYAFLLQPDAEYPNEYVKPYPYR